MKILKITSKDNKQIKLLRKLKQKKYREKYSLFFTENLNIIYDALKANFIFDKFFVTEEFIAKNTEKFKYILKASKIKQYYLIGNQVNNSFSDLDSPSGICALYRQQKRKVDFTKSIVYLNGINNPGNLGTILRSALAFSFKNIVIDEYSADIYNYKTINSAKETGVENVSAWLWCSRGRSTAFSRHRRSTLSAGKRFRQWPRRSTGPGGIALVGDALCLNRSVNLIGNEPWGTSVPSSIPLGRVQRRRTPTRYDRLMAASRALVGVGTAGG